MMVLKIKEMFYVLNKLYLPNECYYVIHAAFKLLTDTLKVCWIKCSKEWQENVL